MTALLPKVLTSNEPTSAFAVQPSLRQLGKMPLMIFNHSPDVPNDEMAIWVETRIWLMLGIFVVSLFGV